jgi:acyl-CoA thioester hydrolase
MRGGAWPDLGGRMDGCTHVLPVRIYYEDTDFSGRVYHASYLRLCERGRSELLRSAGLSHSGLLDEADGVGTVFFAVCRMEIDFLGAATIDDLLEVCTTFAGCTGARLVIEQQVRRGESDIMRARVTVAALGGDGRPRRIPSRLVNMLALVTSADGEMTGNGTAS